MHVRVEILPSGKKKRSTIYHVNTPFLAERMHNMSVLELKAYPTVLTFRLHLHNPFFFIIIIDGKEWSPIINLIVKASKDLLHSYVSTIRGTITRECALLYKMVHNIKQITTTTTKTIII